MRHPLRATIQWLCRMAEAIAIMALIAATALIMLQIVAREIFVAGLSWADELARYAGLTVIFMGVPALLARDEHVKVDMFLNMMPTARAALLQHHQRRADGGVRRDVPGRGLAVHAARRALRHAGARHAEPDLLPAGRSSA